MLDNLFNIRQLPQSILNVVHKIIVNRQGDRPDAMMITLDISGYIAPNTTYQFTWKSAPQEKQVGFIERKNSIVNFPQYDSSVAPNHAVIQGRWDELETVFNPVANILGGMGTYHMNTPHSHIIPVLTATEENLAFYRAQLLSIGSLIKFETKDELPIVDVSVGHHYVEHFLSKEEYGGGEYLEYHDQPHLWAPQTPDCSGHILLGRQENNHLYLTGFRIPFGKAIYMSPLTLHSDAYLIGDYLVVYTVTETYSTVIFKKPDGTSARLQFVMD